MHHGCLLLAAVAGLAVVLTGTDARAGDAVVDLAMARTGTEASAGDPEAGEEVFAQRCSMCHELDRHKVCPMLRGIHGRKAGSTDYDGYIGLRRAKFVWNDETLDEWLMDTQAFIKNRNRRATIGKIFELEDAKQRADVIEYLRTVE